jgi:hypothetical protein
MHTNKKGGRTMRAKIRATAVEGPGGYRMVAIKTDGTIEYPQEGLIHKTKADVYRDARAMYNNTTWSWRERDKTIVID